MSSSGKFDIEKLSEKSDFGLWKVKLQAVLVQQGTSVALKGDAGFDKTFDPVEKGKILEKAHSTLILSLSDNVLRDVAKLTTAKEIWEALEAKYHVKSAANQLFLRNKLLRFKMVEEKSILDPARRHRPQLLAGTGP